MLFIMFAFIFWFRLQYELRNFEPMNTYWEKPTNLLMNQDSGQKWLKPVLTIQQLRKTL